MSDLSRMKLGKLSPKYDGKRVLLSKYLPEVLPEAPKDQDWIGAITDWGMMKNDLLGCCTISAIGHAIQVWTANLGKGGLLTIPDSAIVDYYSKWAGYDPSNPLTTDNGAVEVEVLNKWRKDPILSSHKLLGYADLDYHSIEHVKLGILFFGGVYIGLNLPNSAQVQNIWDFVAVPGCEPGSWGGHAVFCPSYNHVGPVCVTWGKVKQMTWKFWKHYCDESHALLSSDWLNDKNYSAYGLNLQQLTEDLGKL